MNKSPLSGKKAATIKKNETGFECLGHWNVHHLHKLNDTLKRLATHEKDTLTLHGEQIEAFDSAGALTIYELTRYLESQNKKVTLTGFSPSAQSLIELARNQSEHLALPKRNLKTSNTLEFIGREFAAKLNQVDDFIVLLGDLTLQLIGAFTQIKRLQIPSIVSVVYSAGLTALPILGLLAFLIGVVLAYQMGLQLQTYGANRYIAYLSGLAIFREFGPLITAIIVAGRTSSSFTAQIGSMVVNEEVDAIRAMGLSPIDLLVVPKVLALLIVFPLLIFWADLFSILGSMFMSKAVLEVGYADFLHRLRDAVGERHFFVGLYKAPTFAILIALVGCFQGFRVSHSTDSIGLQTTRSVVQALFLIIVADAIYSVIYSWVDI